MVKGQVHSDFAFIQLWPKLVKMIYKECLEGITFTGRTFQSESMMKLFSFGGQRLKVKVTVTSCMPHPFHYIWHKHPPGLLHKVFSLDRRVNYITD